MFLFCVVVVVVDFSGLNIFRCGSMPNPLMGFLTLRECPKILWMYVIVSVIIFIPCLPRRDIGSLRWPAVYSNVTRMKKKEWRNKKKRADEKYTSTNATCLFCISNCTYMCGTAQHTVHRTPYAVHHTVHASVHFARLLLLFFFILFSYFFFSPLLFLYAIHIIRSFYNN